MAKRYTEDDVEVYRGLDGVRKKPAMYLGQQGNPMYFTCVREVLDNAADEYLAGRNDHIELIVDREKDTVVIADKGSGIPVGIHKKEKVSTLTLIFGELHAGAKFSGKGYAVAGGTHGVGASAVNAVSELFEVWTHRDGKWYYQSWAKGKVRGQVKEWKLPKDVSSTLSYKPKCGTIVRFKPDHECISLKSKAKLIPKELSVWLRNKSLLNPKLTIRLCVDGKEKTYFNKDLKPLIEKSLKDFEADPVGKPLLHADERCTLALQWSSLPSDEGLMTYVSSINTTEHGEHEVGFRNALNKALSAHKSKKEKWAPKDLYCGLLGHFDWKMSKASFSSQTKEKLTSDVSKEVEDRLFPIILEFFNKNKGLARKVIKMALNLKKAKDEMQKSLKSVKDASKKAGGNPPNIHITCPRCPPGKRELFIVEGESANGSAKKARNKENQELLRLDGKIMNAGKQPLAKLLASTSILYILNAIGYDLKALKNGQDPTKNLRVDKIYHLTDADVDGGHIDVLSLTLLHKLVPRLFDEGRVYLVDAPLFSAYHKGNRYYGKTFKEVKKQLPKSANVQIIRSKGWGEISVSTLREIAFDPKTRRLIKVTNVKGKDLLKFERLIGSETIARKELLGLN